LAEPVAVPHVIKHEIPNGRVGVDNWRGLLVPDEIAGAAALARLELVTVSGAAAAGAGGSHGHYSKLSDSRWLRVLDLFKIRFLRGLCVRLPPFIAALIRAIEFVPRPFVDWLLAVFALSLVHLCLLVM
jgi:hypothetical protein